MAQLLRHSPRSPVPILWRLLASLAGWHVRGELPPGGGFVMVFAPHASNWDFLVGVMATRVLRARPRFLAKRALFKGPVGLLMRRLRGVPVDQGQAAGLVARCAAWLREGDVVALLPSGTRERAPWKPGFARMAQAAGAPMVLLVIDYHRREVQVHPAVPAADLERFMALAAESIGAVRVPWPGRGDLPFLEQSEPLS